MTIKNIAAQYRISFNPKRGYINANQEFTRWKNYHNILPLFGGLERSLTCSHLLSYTMKHTHTSQKVTMDRGWKRDGYMLASPPTLWVLFIVKTEN
jgi:hypothetical protein